MENVLSLIFRASATLIFVFALSVAGIVVSGVDSCTTKLEQVMEYDDVMTGADRR